MDEIVLLLLLFVMSSCKGGELESLLENFVAVGFDADQL